MMPLSPLERQIISTVVARNPSIALDFEIDKVGVLSRDRSDMGQISELSRPRPSVVGLGARIRRLTLVLKHKDLPLDGSAVLLLDELGHPVELEYSSFDGSQWPHHAPVEAFALFDEMGEVPLWSARSTD